MAIWRCMIGLCGALCVLLLTVEAVEFYDDIPPGFESDVIYQDESYPDIGPLGPFTNPRYEDPLKDLMLYKLLKNMRDNEVPYTTTFYMPKYTFEDKNLPRGDIMKEPVKRLTHAPKTVANVPKITKPVVVPQLKWKKKVKTVGSHIVCYFKLCGIRAP
ncbi:hypothetical protein K1T71_008038 [Dendrolimus kikuchii]|uniref:Uncharacterized protein n=1 Tax=Dendrolimus kikuchii TaxID=765133 RepID=A0ACC1CZF8_9NEOP|nr:hypothetical protein K1T71_008038 [Dendrolimus kikuchii]